MKSTILAAVLCFAACHFYGTDAETITLADGRVLNGVLTEKPGRKAAIALVDPKGAIFTVNIEDIRERAPYKEPTAAVQEPKKEESAAKAVDRARPLATSLASVLDLHETKKRIMAEASAAERKCDFEMVDKFFAWVKAANLKPVPVVAVSADPRASEVARAKRVELYNAMVKQFNAMEAGYHQTPPEQRKGRADIQPYLDRISELAESKDEPAILEEFNSAPR